jgi:hypothetical protein
MFGRIRPPHIFFVNEAKLLILRHLPSRDAPRQPQNIANKRLTGKIFQNKEFAVFSGGWSLPSVPAVSLLMRLRTIPLCAFCVLGQGCPSQGAGFLLRRTVEKYWWLQTVLPASIIPGTARFCLR